MDIFTEIITRFYKSPMTFIQLITLVVVLFKVKKFKNSVEACFIYLFAYAVFNEFAATYYGLYLFSEVTPNNIFYNVYGFVSFLVLFYIYHQKINSQLFRKLIVLSVVIYIVLILFEVVYKELNYLRNSQVVPFVFAGIMILVCILFYFYEVFISERVIHLDRTMIFWVSIGFFLYYLTIIPFKIDQNFYATDKRYRFLFELSQIRAVIFNVSFLIGVLWSRPNREETL